MSERIVFYQLSHKFVDDRADIPENARQVVYYALAIGHHIGVMDCFASLMEIPCPEFERWVGRLPAGTVRRKLEGVLKWGEIEITHHHAGELLPVLEGALPQMDAAEAGWAARLASSARQMLAEPALYLMVRRRAA